MLWRGLHVRRVVPCSLVALLLIYSFDVSFRGGRDDKSQHYNYLEPKEPMTVLLDLPTCTIPLELEPPARVTGGDAHCDSNRPSITYVRGNRIFINSSFHDADCCYKGIIRKEGYDNETSLTPECVKIRSGDAITSYDFVVVVCNYGGSVFDDYQALVQRKPVGNRKDAPSILMVGLDSVSRFHYHTLMPETKKVLDGLGAIEMLGYTKVGENTFPNAVAFLSGYEESCLTEFCYNRTHPIDSCPFIWRDLRMTTALLEDAPRIAIFNYYRYGFFHQPTSHYLRPLMLTALNDFYTARNQFPCVGSRSTEEFIVDHIQELHSIEKPLFLFAWMTTLAHEDVESLPRADKLFSRFFSTQNFDNTIVIFMSDHGHRWGDGRTTYNGWYNEKLPFFSIALPPRVKSVLGEQRVRNLKANARKLTSPFDVYRTLIEILTLYKLRGPTNDVAKIRGVEVPRKWGISLFSHIPDSRSCEEAGIPEDFCACGVLKPMDVRDPLLQRTAEHALSLVNRRLPPRCSPLSVGRITGGAALNEREFVVGFTTSPGEFRLESFGLLNGTLAAHRVSRVSKITSAWCVNDWYLELYCHCNIFGLVQELVFGGGYKKPRQ